MTTRRNLFAATLVAALTLGTGFAAFAADSHQHASGEPAKLALDHGKKWATDAPLRKAMGELRAALAAKHESIHKGTLTPADYKMLGTTVEAKVATIVAECKLEPAADENLHIIVAELIAGADAMQGKSKTAPAAGAVLAVQTVNRYGDYFDHPGWKALR
ncbi:MAG: hypothetical protein IPP91_10335 [Betaproteobacteria bacterium]|nr:hypothetical protein [Betaproteobacteria bacterium]